jgi:hypothetical protein
MSLECANLFLRNMGRLSSTRRASGCAAYRLGYGDSCSTLAMRRSELLAEPLVLLTKVGWPPG